MKILFVCSLLVIIVTLFPVGILFAFWAKKSTRSERNLWSYAKALILTALMIFAFFYLSSFFLSKTYGFGVVLFLTLILLIALMAVVYKKGWHKYEKMAIIFWGILVFPVCIFLNYFLSLSQPFIIADGGMAPTFNRGDLVFCQINRNLFGGYSRGDVVIFPDPDGGRKNLIRKIVGTEGDSVEINDRQFFANGQAIRNVQANELIAPTVLKKGEYFVLAEDENNRYDSKTFGPINDKNILIKVLFKLSWLKNDKQGNH